MRSHWCNCAVGIDDEIQKIDEMEDHISPVDPDVVNIRKLISTFELCHHKAEKWIQNIIEAIATGETNKGLGTRTAGQVHAAEEVWQNACTVLSAWCEGTQEEVAELQVSSISASQLLEFLGEPSALKEWQVRRVIEKISSTINWPPCPQAKLTA